MKLICGLCGSMAGDIDRLIRMPVDPTRSLLGQELHTNSVLRGAHAKCADEAGYKPGRTFKTESGEGTIWVLEDAAYA